MELTFKKDFDLTKNTLQHRIVIDTIELLNDKENCTRQEIISMTFLAMLQNICEEDVVALVTKEQDKNGFWRIFEEVVEPKALEALGGNVAPLFDIANAVEIYKDRAIEMNGKFFYAVREIIQTLSELDTSKIADVIVSANSLKNQASTEIKKVAAEEEIGAVNEKMQDLINKFKATK